MKNFSIILTILILHIQFAQQSEIIIQSSNSDATYSPSLALKLWRFSKLSYCKTGDIEQWSYDKICDQYPGAADISTFYSSKTDGQGYSFYLPSDNVIYLVFRGTQAWSIKNWISDINTFYGDFDKCDGCKVHKGFHYAYLDLQQQVLSAVKSLIQKYSGAKLMITGHSLGASIAIHAAADLKSITNIDSVYTFGLPRVGNRKFQEWFDANVVDNYVARVTHKRDPVPQLPPIEFGFTHTNTEIFYDEDSKNYKVCADTEDKTCQNKNLLNLNILNHLTYMGEDVTSDIILCGIL